MTINHYERAYTIWKLLVETAKYKKVITYREIKEKTNIHWRAENIPLDYIQQYCLEKDLPPLSILAVNSTTRHPGPGFTACSEQKIGAETKRVFDYPWDTISNPFEFATNVNDIDEIVDAIKKGDFTSKKVSQIQSRGILQNILKKAAMSLYNNKCAFCGLSIEPLLQACHIKPYSDCSGEEQKDLKNIIILCANHHKLFDSGLISLDTNYKMHVSKEFQLKTNADKTLIEHIDNVTITLPSDVKYYPGKEYINFVNN